MENKLYPYVLREIGREENRNMLEILKESPVDSKGLTICFDREPDIFLVPDLTSEHLKCAGFFREKRLLGFAMLSYQYVYVNGLPKIVMYYCNIHARKEGRKKGFFYKTSDFFLRDSYKTSNLGYAIIMKKNENAERFVGQHKSGYPLLPASKIISDLKVVNIITTFRKRESSEYQVRKATLEDIDSIVSMIRKEFSKRLFAPVMDRSVFLKNLEKRPRFGISNYYIAEKDGKAVGVCAAWDTGIFKQNRIIRYGRKLKMINIFYAILARLFGLPQMPREGDAIRDVTIIECAAKDRSPDILEALLLKIYNEYRDRRYNMMIIGSCANDPLLKATKKFFTHPVVSSIILFSNDESLLDGGKIDTSLPYIDLVML
jgi:hypothetical protein